MEVTFIWAKKTTIFEWKFWLVSSQKIEVRDEILKYRSVDVTIPLNSFWMYAVRFALTLILLWGVSLEFAVSQICSRKKLTKQTNFSFSVLLVYNFSCEKSGNFDYFSRGKQGKVREFFRLSLQTPCCIFFSQKSIFDVQLRQFCGICIFSK